MAEPLSTFDDAMSHGYDTVIDVRAPSEFAEDHMPGAINLPVLSDAERAEVGTIYKQVSPFRARKIGAALVARNAANHIEGPLAGHDGGWRPLLYCWRGGQRSGAFAGILSQIGWRVGVVEGGYRSYRRTVRALLYETPLPHRVVLLDGNTGSGKTDLLHRVAALGGQMIDLEGLANHRGSVFGGLGAQPPQKAFETALARVLHGLDPARPVLIEAESSKVGARIVPPSLWAAMGAAPRLWLEVPAPARADYLVQSYGATLSDRAALLPMLQALVPHQGHAKVEHWSRLARDGALRPLAEALITHHYDPRYGRHRVYPRPAQVIESDRLDDAGLERAAQAVCAALDRL